MLGSRCRLDRKASDFGDEQFVQSDSAACRISDGERDGAILNELLELLVRGLPDASAVIVEIPRMH